MPYVFMEELGEGMEEADVVDRDAYTTLETERDVLQLERDEANGKVESLKAELESAKTKFADAFLTTPERMKSVQASDIAEDSVPQTFDALFAGRNKHNAN